MFSRIKPLFSCAIATAFVSACASTPPASQAPVPEWFETARSGAQEGVSGVPELRDVPVRPTDVPSAAEFSARITSVLATGEEAMSEIAAIPELARPAERHAELAQMEVAATIEGYENIEGRTQTILRNEAD